MFTIKISTFLHLLDRNYSTNSLFSDAYHKFLNQNKELVLIMVKRSAKYLFNNFMHFLGIFSPHKMFQKVTMAPTEPI